MEFKDVFMMVLPANLFLIFFVSAVFGCILFPSLLGETFGESIAQQPDLWFFSSLLFYAHALLVVPFAAGYLAMRILEEFKMAILAGIIHGLISGLASCLIISCFLIPFGLDLSTFLTNLFIWSLLATIAGCFLGFGGAWFVDREIRTIPSRFKVFSYITLIGVSFFVGALVGEGMVIIAVIILIVIKFVIPKIRK